MSASVVCRRCGCQVRVPAGVNLRKARCSKCRGQLAPPANTLQLAPVAAPKAASRPADPNQTVLLFDEDLPSPATLPKPVLSLDDAETPPPARPKGPILSLDDDPEPPPPPRAPKKPPSLSESVAEFPEVLLPPPFRVAARMRKDSAKALRGPVTAVLTPFGLFLETVPNQPAVFAPVGTHAQSVGGVVALGLPDRKVQVEFTGVRWPSRLAAETVAFLGGAQPVPDPADYRRPWGLLAAGAVLATGLGLAFGLVVGASGLNTVLGGVAAVLLGIAVAGANIKLALSGRLSSGTKFAAMGGACFAGLAVFLMVALVAQALHGTPQPTDPSTPGDALAAATGDPSNAESPAAQGTSPRPAPTHIDLAYRDGMSRLDDGPAPVTALALTPAADTLVVGHADGSTRVWRLDQPSFEPSLPGPWGQGAVRRITFDSTGTFAFLTSDNAMAASSLSNPRISIVMAGDVIAANADRFAAFRGGRLQVRYLPMTLVKNPPPGEVGAGKRFHVTIAKDEGIPAGVPPNITSPKPTFLVWHPSGQLMGGTNDGSIVTWPTTNMTSRQLNKVHKAAVRAWAVGPVWPDFATGDDSGVVGYWPDKTTTPVTFSTGKAAVTHLAFSQCGGDLVVTDAAGGLSMWGLPNRTKEFAIKRPRPVGAVVFGPGDDILFVADGKGVEVWWLPELAAKANGS